MAEAEGANMEEEEVPFARDIQESREFWDSTGINIWKKLMDPIGYVFDGIGLGDLEGDNSIGLMSKFVARCKSHPPVSDYTGKPYKVDSILKTLLASMRKLKEKVRGQVPGNTPEFFPSEDIQKWKKAIKNNHGRVHMEGEDESAFMKDCYPIPRQHSERTALLPLVDFSDRAQREESRKIDMYFIACTMFSRQKLEELLQVQLTWNGIGRSGEVKFLTYASFFFCFTYNGLFLQWFQRKNLKTNPSAFFIDYMHPEMCILFLLGCFWAIRRGLERSDIGEDKSSARRKALYVFQKLHSVKDDTVAKSITSYIKSCIPASIRAFFSGRSLRYGAMTLLSWDPAVSYEEAVALGGWTTPSNASYYVWMYLVAVIPAALALAGYPDVRMIPYLPDIGKIFSTGLPAERCTADQWSAFVQHLFVVQLPQFEVGGCLRDLLTTVATVMVMNFSHCFKKYGGHHEYCRKMIHTCLKAGMATDQATAVKKLSFWSKTLRDDFVHNNVHGTEARNDTVRRRTIPDQLQSLNEKVRSIIQSKTEMLASLVESRAESILLRDQVGQASTQMQVVGEQNEKILTNQRLLLLQNQRILDFLGLPRSEGPITADALLGASANLPTPGVALAAGPALLIGTQETTIEEERMAVSPSQQTQPRRAVVPFSRQNTGAPVAQGGRAHAVAAGVAGRVVTVAEALMRPRVRGIVGPRGQASSNESMVNIIKELYDSHKNVRFSGLVQGASPYLNFQATHIHQVILNGKDSARPKIIDALDLWDALWEPKERHAIINRTGGSPCVDYSIIERIGRRYKLAMHYLKGDGNPKTIEPGKALKDQILGSGNNIIVFKNEHGLEQYIPRWNQEGQPIPKGHALMVVVNQRIAKRKNVIMPVTPVTQDPTPRVSGGGSGRGGGSARGRGGGVGTGRGRASTARGRGRLTGRGRGRGR
jgi:hypothetical protein